MVPPELHTLLQALQDTVGQDSTALKDICTNNQQASPLRVASEDARALVALLVATHVPAAPSLARVVPNPVPEALVETAAASAARHLDHSGGGVPRAQLACLALLLAPGPAEVHAQELSRHLAGAGAGSDASLTSLALHGLAALRAATAARAALTRDAAAAEALADESRTAAVHALLLAVVRSHETAFSPGPLTERDLSRFVGGVRASAEELAALCTAACTAPPAGALVHGETAAVADLRGALRKYLSDAEADVTLEVMLQNPPGSRRTSLQQVRPPSPLAHSHRPGNLQANPTFQAAPRDTSTPAAGVPFVHVYSSRGRGSTSTSPRQGGGNAPFAPADSPAALPGHMPHMVRHGGSDAFASAHSTLNAAYMPSSQPGSSRNPLPPPTPRTPATPSASGRFQTMAAATGRLIREPGSPARSSQPDSARWSARVGGFQRTASMLSGSVHSSQYVTLADSTAAGWIPSVSTSAAASANRNGISVTADGKTIDVSARPALSAPASPRGGARKAPSLKKQVQERMPWFKSKNNHADVAPNVHFTPQGTTTFKPAQFTMPSPAFAAASFRSGPPGKAASAGREGGKGAGKAVKLPTVTDKAMAMATVAGQMMVVAPPGSDAGLSNSQLPADSPRAALAARDSAVASSAPSATPPPNLVGRLLADSAQLARAPRDTPGPSRRRGSSPNAADTSGHGGGGSGPFGRAPPARRMSASPQREDSDTGLGVATGVAPRAASASSGGSALGRVPLAAQLPSSSFAGQPTPPGEMPPPERPPSADVAARAPTISANFISSSVSFGDDVGRPQGAATSARPSPRNLSLSHRAGSANAATAELFCAAEAVAAAEPSFANVATGPPTRARHGLAPSISLPVAGGAAAQGPPTPALAPRSASDELYDETQQFVSFPPSPPSPAAQLPSLLTGPAGLRPVRTSRGEASGGEGCDAAVVLPGPPAPRVTIKEDHTFLGIGAAGNALGAADVEGDLLATGDDGSLSTLLADMRRQRDLAAGATASEWAYVARREQEARSEVDVVRAVAGMAAALGGKIVLVQGVRLILSVCLLVGNAAVFWALITYPDLSIPVSLAIVVGIDLLLALALLLVVVLQRPGGGAGGLAELLGGGAKSKQTADQIMSMLPPAFEPVVSEAVQQFKSMQGDSGGGEGGGRRGRTSGGLQLPLIDGDPGISGKQSVSQAADQARAALEVQSAADRPQMLNRVADVGQSLIDKLPRQQRESQVVKMAAMAINEIRDFGTQQGAQQGAQQGGAGRSSSMRR